MKNKKLNNKKNNFALTKNIPLKRHPAIYRKTGKKDQIEYITTTHSNPANINGHYIETRELRKNLNKNDNKKGYLLPIVFEGKRSSLGKEITHFTISKEDYNLVNELFINSPRKYIKYTSNSRNIEHKKKKSI